MSSVIHIVAMWWAVVIAFATTTIRRLLLGPTLPSWTWRTEWAVASARAVIRTAASYRDDPLISRFGLRVTTPVPRDLRSRVDVRRIRLGSNEGDRYLPSHSLHADTTLLYFHGGGYVFGNPGTHRQFIARLVEATGTGAVAPRYRLAPDARYPAAVDDALDAYRWLLDSGTDAASIVVAGDSAGGGLAMALLIRIRSVGLPPPAGAILFSPYLDLEHTGYSVRANARTDYLPLAELSGPNTWYAEISEMRLPEVSPIHADLHGLPPLLVFAGGAEMLLADSERLVENATRDGVAAELVIEPEMMHVWPAIADWEPASRRALDRAARWIAELSARTHDTDHHG
jgi:epsilon-lactone hydrolase